MNIDIIHSPIFIPQTQCDLNNLSCHDYSGCVTSAEEVLIQEQSHDKLVEKLRDPSAVVIVTLSPQSVASIGSMLQISALDSFVVIASMLKSVGIRYVLDASSGGDVALHESGHEFLRRSVLFGVFIRKHG